MTKYTPVLRHGLRLRRACHPSVADEDAAEVFDFFDEVAMLHANGGQIVATAEAGKYGSLFPAIATRRSRDSFSAMTFEKIREAVEKRPFRAFTLHLNDGHCALVDHPELVILPPDTEEVVVVYEVPGGVRIIDVDSVTEISVGIVRRNGHARAKRKRP